MDIQCLLRNIDHNVIRKRDKKNSILKKSIKQYNNIIEKYIRDTPMEWEDIDTCKICNNNNVLSSWYCESPTCKIFYPKKDIKVYANKNYYYVIHELPKCDRCCEILTYIPK